MRRTAHRLTVVLGFVPHPNLRGLLYSLVETAKATGLEPHAYLTYLFEHLPTANTPEAIAALLPQNPKLDDIRPQGAIL